MTELFTPVMANSPVFAAVLAEIERLLQNGATDISIMDDGEAFHVTDNAVSGAYLIVRYAA